nr:hypothetical protein [Prauserella endophytica]
MASTCLALPYARNASAPAQRVQCAHQARPWPFAQRIVLGERLEGVHGLGGAAERELRLGELLTQLVPQLDEPAHLAVGTRDALEGLSSPQRERRLERADRGRQLTGLGRRPCRGGVLGGPVRVHLSLPQAQPVPARRALDPRLAFVGDEHGQQPPQPPHVCLQVRLGGGGRRGRFVPCRVDQLGAADPRVRVQQQRRQHGRGLAVAEPVYLAVAAVHLQRPQNTEEHGSNDRGTNMRFR